MKGFVGDIERLTVEKRISGACSTSGGPCSSC
jgi:hypothetical protein